MRPQTLRRSRGTSERNHVLTGQVLEEVANTAADELDRSLRENPRLDDTVKHSLRQIGGGRGRLDDRGHAGEQRRGQLLQHSPNGKIEGVDVDRRPLQRNTDMLADKGAALGEDFRRAVDVHLVIGQLAGAFARVHEERADAAVDVDPGIVLRRAGRVGEPVKFVLVLRKHFRERLELRRSLVKGQFAKMGAADLACMSEHRSKVDAGR